MHSSTPTVFLIVLLLPFYSFCAYINREGNFQANFGTSSTDPVLQVSVAIWWVESWWVCLRKVVGATGATRKRLWTILCIPRRSFFHVTTSEWICVACVDPHTLSDIRQFPQWCYLSERVWTSWQCSPEGLLGLWYVELILCPSRLPITIVHIIAYWTLHAESPWVSANRYGAVNGLHPLYIFNSGKASNEGTLACFIFREPHNSGLYCRCLRPVSNCSPWSFA